jgi:hypothetical protein
LQKNYIEFKNEAVQRFAKKAEETESESNPESYMVLMESGFLHMGNEYYTFCELPAIFAGEPGILQVPAGTYSFRQDKISQIENAPGIFKENAGSIFVEAEELMSGKSKINEPIFELRLINL